MYRDYEGEPVYFGPPSAEIDANWGALLKGSGLDLSGAEADSVKDWTFEEAQRGLWRTGYGFPSPTCRTVACLSDFTDEEQAGRLPPTALPKSCPKISRR